MPNDTIELREVTTENWLQCIKLELDPGQIGFVSSNLYSLAQSKFEPCRIPCAIYNTKNELVGFAMYNDNPLEDGSYRISRIMVDISYQGRGYARKAALEIIERLKQIEHCREIFLDYAPNNLVAAKLWGSLGFEECGNEGANVLTKLQIR